jgi:hypothetical protein
MSTEQKNRIILGLMTFGPDEDKVSVAASFSGSSTVSYIDLFLGMVI